MYKGQPAKYTLLFLPNAVFLLAVLRLKMERRMPLNLLGNYFLLSAKTPKGRC